MVRLLIFIIISSVICHNEISNPMQTSGDNEETTGCKDSTNNCSNLDSNCLHCTYPSNCTYGEYYNVTCCVDENLKCEGDRTFQKIAKCRYCYQTEKWEHTCVLKHHCLSVASPPQYYKTNCTVHADVICLGRRKFPKKLRCNWTRGHKWSTALILSITLGGFGADRFYLGHWQEGIGKLFSFGGLGVWTLVDVLLIAIRYLGPADGSFYV